MFNVQSCSIKFRLNVQLDIEQRHIEQTSVLGVPFCSTRGKVAFSDTMLRIGTIGLYTVKKNLTRCSVQICGAEGMKTTPTLKFGSFLF